MIEMRWPDVENELASVDQGEFHRLCRPDYYAFFT